VVTRELQRIDSVDQSAASHEHRMENLIPILGLELYWSNSAVSEEKQ